MEVLIKRYMIPEQPIILSNGLIANPIIAYGTLVLLLLLSAFFSSTETAFTSFSVIRMKNLAKTKKSARLAIKLRDSYDRFISTILIGNNIVNIAGTSLATLIAVEQNFSTGVMTIIVTISVLICGEILPKSLAKLVAEKYAMLVVYPITVLYYIFYPISLFFELFNKLIKKIFKIKEEPTMTEEEFELLVDNIQREGVLNNIEKKLILNTIEYGDLLVEDIMTKGRDVVYVQDGDSYDTIQEVFEKYNYSRLPIAKTNKVNTIYGIIYQKEFYEMLINDEKDLKSIIAEPIITKPNIKISRLLKTLQKEHQHMAFVRSNNKIIGIITLEDIIEELVGEIEDEYDIERDEQAELDEALEELEKKQKEDEKVEEAINNQNF